MENTVEKNHVRPVTRAGSVLRAVAGVALAILVCAVLVGCDKTTKPKDVKYNLYVGATHLYASPGDSSFNRIYIYDADSLTLLDSIWQAHFTVQLAASPDGRWLYVLDFTGYWQAMTLWKIDARTKQVAWSRADHPGGYARFAADGKLLLLGNDVIQPDDGGLVGHIDDSLRVQWGPVSGTKVAATVSAAPVGVANDSVIRVLDVATGEVTGGYVARLSSGIALQGIYTARLHPDGRRVLAIGVYTSVYNSWFVVGDVVTGQTLFEYRISFPQGEIAISSDGSLAAFTDQGSPALGEQWIPRVIDLRTYQVTEPALHGPAIMGSQVRFLPGDRKIVTAPAADPSFFDAGSLQVIDVATMTLEKTIWPMPSDPPKKEHVGSLGIGPRP